MKNIILIILAVITLNSCGLDLGGDYGWKYNIIDNRGIVYHTNFYNKTGDGCLLFNDEPGTDNTPGTPIMLCGNYTIIQVKR